MLPQPCLVKGNSKKGWFYVSILLSSHSVFSNGICGESLLRWTRDTENTGTREPWVGLMGNMGNTAEVKEIRSNSLPWIRAMKTGSCVLLSGSCLTRGRHPPVVHRLVPRTTGGGPPSDRVIAGPRSQLLASRARGAGAKVARTGSRHCRPPAPAADVKQ